MADDPKVEIVRKLDLKDGDVLQLVVDTDEWPPAKRGTLLDAWEIVVPNGVRIIVTPKGVEATIVRPPDES